MKTAFINGKIYTVNKEQPIAQAVLIEDNKIVFVGSNEEAEKFIDASTKVIDLNSKLMLPGFIDAHLHMISGGFYTLEVDLRPAKSRAEFTSILKEYVKKNPGEWVTQGRWDNEKWDDKSLPTKDWIDDFSQTTPILVKRIDGHLALANSYALKLAGITKDTPSPEGGIIVKDPVTGDPNGLLKDLALELFDTVISEPPEDDYINAALAALNEFKAFGITSVQDITFNFAGDENKPLYDLQTYKQLEKNHQLTCRIQARIPIDYYKDLLDKNILHNSGTNYVKLGSIKAYGDGALGSRSAWFFEPYADDSSNYGLVYDIISNGSLKRWALDADKNKLQISIHAIGDRTNNYVLNLYEEIKNETMPFWDNKSQSSNTDPKLIKIEEALKKGFIKSQAYAWCLYIAYMHFVNFGIPIERIRLRQHASDEKAFYADDAWDIEIKLNNFGWVEVCGVHDRTDYDLKQHSKHSNVELIAQRDNGEKFTPHILEIAFGTDRPTYALIDLFYEKKSEEQGKTTFSIPYHIAPIDASIFPLMKKPELVSLAKDVKVELERDFIVDYD